MELHALDGVLTVTDRHDLAVLRSRGDDERCGNPRRGERVVPAGLELRGQSPEDAAAVVLEDARLPVQERARLSHLSSVGLDDRLVPEADAERGRRRAEADDELERATRVGRTAGPGEITSRSGAIASASAAVRSSLCLTITVAPSSSSRCTRL
jgi:hypothetical protein